MSERNPFSDSVSSIDDSSIMNNQLSSIPHEIIHIAESSSLIRSKIKNRKRPVMVEEISVLDTTADSNISSDISNTTRIGGRMRLNPQKLLICIIALFFLILISIQIIILAKRAPPKVYLLLTLDKPKRLLRPSKCLPCLLNCPSRRQNQCRGCLPQRRCCTRCGTRRS